MSGSGPGYDGYAAATTNAGGIQYENEQGKIRREINLFSDHDAIGTIGFWRGRGT